ncbi:hypothetical protein BGW80DRAFT_406543 [Lactifluus volemus]|nr:hypothetical protein BGW80DRAFT_406543 [Lactifluus volemus]
MEGAYFSLATKWRLSAHTDDHYGTRYPLSANRWILGGRYAPYHVESIVRHSHGLSLVNGAQHHSQKADHGCSITCKTQARPVHDFFFFFSQTSLTYSSFLLAQIPFGRSGHKQGCRIFDGRARSEGDGLSQRDSFLSYRTLCGSGHSDLPTVDSVTDSHVDSRPWIKDSGG